jgi:hypothetical protein
MSGRRRKRRRRRLRRSPPRGRTYAREMERCGAPREASAVVQAGTVHGAQHARAFGCYRLDRTSGR